eukprot:3621412-Pyramimonas_sp.AAC.1
MGREADVSILTWHFQRTKLAGSSSLAADANEMSEGLAGAERVTSWISNAKDFRCELRDRHAMDREVRAATIMEQSSELDIVTTTDTSSPCDCTARGQLAAF